MGVQISELIKGKEISLEELLGKRIAIDAFNWIYQFLSIIRQKDGEPLKDSHGRITSHLSGLFYRTAKLLQSGIKPIYVFDGEPPFFKAEESEKRREARLKAEKEWKLALLRKDYEEAKKYAQRASFLSDEMIEDSKNLLEAMGVPVIQAPSEGEALCAAMTKRNDAYAIATQDYDSLLFGAQRLIINLSITGKRKHGEGYITINPELIVLKDVLKRLGINQNQLIILGILIGTDYNIGGVRGLGPKRALELVKKKNLKEILSEIEWEFEIPFEEIYEFFKSPPKSEYEIEFRDVDENRLKKILCEEHDFSEERVDAALKRIEKGTQKSLFAFRK